MRRLTTLYNIPCSLKQTAMLLYVVLVDNWKCSSCFVVKIFLIVDLGGGMEWGKSCYMTLITKQWHCS